MQQKVVIQLPIGMNLRKRPEEVHIQVIAFALWRRFHVWLFHSIADERKQGIKRKEETNESGNKKKYRRTWDGNVLEAIS